MKARFKRLVPTPESVRDNRWLRWLGPSLLQPKLWHMGRRAIALGVALGVFFGLLIPVAQIPASAAMAVVLRANIPMAIASTLVTNPVTFGPIYYAAYRLGSLLVDDTPVSEEEAAKAVEDATRAIETANTYDPDDTLTWGERVRDVFLRVTSVGKPLLVGLIIMAVVCSTLAYFLVSSIWTIRTLVARRRRNRALPERLQARRSTTPAAGSTHDTAPPSTPHDSTTCTKQKSTL